MGIYLAYFDVERHLVRVLECFLSGSSASTRVCLGRHSCEDGSARFAEGLLRRFFVDRCRGLPGGNLLSLLRQRKKAKKGDPRFVAAARFPALLETSGRCGTRARGCIAQTILCCARPQTVLAECPCRFCVTRRLSSGPGQPITAVFPDVVSASIFMLLALTLALAGCGTTPKKIDPARSSPATTSKPGAYYLDDGPGENPPSLESIPDAVPRIEPLHRGANRTYTVFGKTYVPNVSSEPFRQQGVASWYGRKFHGQKTSMGETYDMYAMTAAHPTLPLPCYVRVTNPVNGKSVVVRVNDRGPFHSDRIIDLSYTAAAKLDYAQRGSAMVMVERIFPGSAGESNNAFRPPVLPITPTPAPNTVVTSPLIPEAGLLYLQLGAFGAMENAEIFRARMTHELDWNREPIQVSHKDNLYRVRMGPYQTREEAEAVAAQVKRSHDFSPIIQQP